LVIDLFQQEYEQAKRLLDDLPPEKHSQERYEAYKKACARYEAALDKAHGPRWLAELEIAEVVKKEIHALHPDQYHLLAYCLMPNHVHLLVDTQDIPDPPPRKNAVRYTALTHALWLLKGRTGHSCQKLLGKEGRFWARESYDHVVRDEGEFVRVLAYIVNNPVKAGLVRDWREWLHTFVDELYKDLVMKCVFTRQSLVGPSP